MSWASRRRTLIALIAVAVAAVLALVIFVPVFYKAPSCMDGKQNRDEEGIDCGGSSCTYLCSENLQEPRQRFVRPFSPSTGRTDVIAYIENPNRNAAAKDVRFTIELYGRDNTVIARKDGSAELPPGALVPVYIPNLFSGYSDVARAFLNFDTESFKWYASEDDRVVPRYNNDALVQGDTAPRVTATLTNPSAVPLRDVLVIATVFDAAGNAMVASQTVIPTIPAQGIAGVTFTWNEPFPAAPGRIDILPVVPLP